MSPVPYFAYGTTQKGFTHHCGLRDVLGEPVGRCRTVCAHAVVVPRRAACSNPGCPYLHRMAALVPGFEPLRVAGDLFLITDEAVAVLDRLETGGAGLAGPYVREPVAIVAPDGATTYLAQAYLAREPARWRALVELARLRRSRPTRAGRRGPRRSSPAASAHRDIPRRTMSSIRSRAPAPNDRRRRCPCNAAVARRSAQRDCTHVLT